MLRTLGRGLSPESDGRLPLSNVVPHCVFDLDATHIASYAGGQIWSNLVPNPATGTTQAQNNALLGTNTSPGSNDPVFSGTPGNPSAAFVFDGDDRFSNLDDPNKWFHGWSENQSFTIAGAYKTPSGSINGATNKNCFIQTGANTATSSGITIRVEHSSRIRLSVSEGTTITHTYINIPTLNTDTWYFFATALDPVSGAYKIHINGAAPITGTINGGRLASTAYDLVISRAFYAGWQQAAFSTFNAVLSDAQVSMLRAAYRARHNRSY